VHGLYDLLALSGSALALLLLPLLAGLATFGILALRKGRRLSLARWGGEPTAAAATRPLSPASPRPAPKQRWIRIVSRVLLAASALFWILLVAGSWFTETGAEPGPAVLGGIVLTVILVSLGVILEVAWQKRRRRSQGAIAVDRGSVICRRGAVS
jgi:hypothetical protein